MRATDVLSSQASITRAAARNAYYDCLDARVRTLVPKGTSVAIGTDPRTPQGLSLLTAVIPWAKVAADTSQAKVVLRLVSGAGQGACSGQEIVASSVGSRT